MQLPEHYLRLAQYHSSEKIVIEFHNIELYVNKSLVVSISPSFFQAIQENPTLKVISIKDELSNACLHDIKAFFNGELIEKESFFQICIFLGNHEFINKWKEENKPNKKTVVKQLLKFIQYQFNIQNMTEEIDIE